MIVRGQLFLFFFCAVCVFNAPFMDAQQLYFPPLTGSTWETKSPQSLGWCTENIDSLYSFLQTKNTKAFIVLKDGRIVLEKYFGTFTADSNWYWASAGKTLTSFLTGIAQYERYFSLSDSTSKYLGRGWTSCPAEKEKLITIRHQLTMTSGLRDAVADPYCTLPSCLLYQSDAGTRWAYHNAPYTLLDKVIENATGQNFSLYFNSRVRSRTGMNGGWLPSGYNNVYYSTARSMARFGILMLNKGVWNADTLMRDTAYFRAMVNTSQSINKSYGYLWWLNGKSSYMLPQTQFVFNGSWAPSAPPEMYAALGKNAQILSVVTGSNLVFVRMGNAPDTTLEVPTAFCNEIWNRLNRIICGPSAAKEEVPPPSEFFLAQNFPNPFNPVTSIQYGVGSEQYGVGSKEYGDGKEALVVLKVYDMLGREAAALVNEEKRAGSYQVSFDGSSLPAGVYIYRLQYGGQSLAKMMVLLK